MSTESPVAQDEEDIVTDGQDIFYICQKSLEILKEKLKKAEDITQELVNELTFPANLPDEELMVPVDMRGVGEDFDDVEQMVERLGPKGTAEAFVKAKEYFDANKDNEPDEERPKPMTAAEWRKVLEDDDLEGEEEEDFLEEEEEDLDDDEEGEEEDEEPEGDDEPAAKKAKTA
mmetsp:Transcript_63526/g.161207  ORF Transcript_63526/g.161207 Transcript_63526/m.161207 type:complete len:174 (-) Transcript_63526:42-563(-)